MSKDAFNFSGKDALNYEQYLGPTLFEPSARLFSSYLGSPSNVTSVLELSCGTGRLTWHLRNYFPTTTRLVASDISSDMLDLAVKRLNDPSIDFQVADAQQLPFADASFDLVVCQYGLMFLPDKLKGFSEAFRVLKQGGRFIFSTWDSTRNIPLFNLIIEELVIPLFTGEDNSRFRTPFSMYEPEKLHKLLKDSGFENGQAIPVKFQGSSTSPEILVEGLFLKHPLGREVADKVPSALIPTANKMTELISQQFGRTEFSFDLKAWIGIGSKL